MADGVRDGNAPPSGAAPAVTGARRRRRTRPELPPPRSRIARMWPWLVLVAAVGLLVYLVFFRGNEVSKVRARLDELADAVAVQGPDQNFVLRAARIRQSFSDVIDKRVVIQVPELAGSKPDRTALVQLAAQAPAVYSEARIELGDLRVELDREEISAHVHGTVTWSGRRQSGGEEREVRAVSIRLDKIDGSWRVVSLAAALPGERAPGE